MLDKSLPYIGFIMKMRQEKLQSLQIPVLPPGYHYRLYEDGDEQHWARLESMVLEFPSQEKALDYFNHDYRDPFKNELYKRCVFVCNENNTPVATATAWFMESSLGTKSWLQWIATDSAHQGKGLGCAVISKALSLYSSLTPKTDIYLHTQTWSHKAMYLYHKLGFELFLIDHIDVSWHKEPGFRVMANAPLEALEALTGVFTPELIQDFKEHAEHPTADELLQHELLPPFPSWYKA